MDAREEEVEGQAPVAEVGEVGQEVLCAEVLVGGGRGGFVAEGEEDGEEGVEGEEESEQGKLQWSHDVGCDVAIYGRWGEGCAKVGEDVDGHLF